MRTVYLDELFLLNLVVDYLLLLAAGRLAGEVLRRPRLALGAALGAGYAAGAVLPGGGFLLHPLCKLGAGVLMVLLAYGHSRRLLRTGLTFFAVSAAFGGGVILLHTFGSRSLALDGLLSAAPDLRLVLLSAAVCYALITLVLGRASRHSAPGELVPAVLHNIKTKKLQPIPSQAEQVRYIFEVYAQESVSLRRLLDLLVAEGKQPLNGSHWTTAKLSTLLKNPIYVKADSDVYDYFDRHGTQIVSDLSLFTGECGAQLYGRTKHDSSSSDWSDLKLVVLSHPGIVESDIWLKCQRKLEKNRQITNSYSNPTSWLAGKVVCAKCGHTMTTIKGKANQNGEVRRYFNCTGKSHKKICTGPKVSIYAEDLENMVYDCIGEKLADLKETGHRARKDDQGALNELKLKLKAVEQAEKHLMDTMLTGGFNEDLLAIANQKATQLKQDRMALLERMDELKSLEQETDTAVNLAKSWKTANYAKKKAVAMIMIHKILIHEDGSMQIVWNI